MSIITGLEHQADFPKEDLSQTNAELLELLLQNDMFVETGHEAAENASWVYKVGHPVVNRVVKVIYDAPERQRAIDHGIKLFESMVTMVTTPPERVAPFAAERVAITLIKGKSLEELRSYTFDIVGLMEEELPLASQTVRSASARNCGILSSYALLGAAMSRQFSVNAAEAGEMS